MFGGARSHAWEDVEADVPGGASDSESDDEVAPLSPGAELVAYMTELYMQRKITAKDMCLLSYWAGQAGVAEVQPHAFRPNAPSGHYQRHLNSSLEFLRDQSALYSMSMPSYQHSVVDRGEHMLHVIPPHEAVASSMTDASARVQFSGLLNDNAMPTAYTSHPLVQAHPGVRPLSLFVDGVPYSEHDGVTGFWVVCEVTGMRWCCAVVRKHLLCVCGCKGWCNFHRIWGFIKWSFQAMAEGTHPTQRHDGEPWTSEDKERAERAGSDLGWRACLLYVKGDWMEFCSSLGLPHFRDGLRPCFFCNVAPDELYQVGELGPLSAPWRVNTAAAYDASCARCEVHVVLPTAAVRDLVCGALRYDKREQGNHGRCLRDALPALGLLAGARLEPSDALPDVGALEKVVSFPLTVVFWLTSEETMTRHRCPLLDERLGTSLASSLAVDTLHCFNLGVLQSWSAECMWFLVLGGAWGFHGTRHETIENACLAIRQDLRVWYNAHQLANPDDRITRIGTFKRRHLREPDDKKLRTKGAETWGIVLFLVARLEREVIRMGAEAGRRCAAGQELVRMNRVWQSSPWRMSAAAIQATFDAWNRFLALTDGMAALETPKRHMMAHLLERQRIQGNPRQYANWLDESLNSELKSACRNTSQVTFERSVLLRMAHFLRTTGRLDRSR